MAATVVSAAFPFDPDPEGLALTKTFKAGSAILRGQVVGFADAATSRTVVPSTSSLGMAIGVAMTSQATTGGDVSVAMQGSTVKVMLDTDTGTVDAGHWVVSGAVAGCVAEMDPAVLTHAALLTVGAYILGYTIDDISAGTGTVGGTGLIVVNPIPLFTKDA